MIIMVKRVKHQLIVMLIKVYAYKVADNIYVYYSIIDCNGYQTDVDTKGPVITFNPNKAITNQNINVVMSIKDNKKVEYYSYQIIKDGTIITTKKYDCLYIRYYNSFKRRRYL